MKEYSSILARDRIIASTLNIINESGLNEVTVRKISEHAKVNVASVNYYFGSKESVINEALNHLTTELINSFNELNQKDIQPKERLKNFLLKNSEVMLKYPDIIKNFVKSTMENHLSKAAYESFMREKGILSLRNTLLEIMPHNDIETINLKTIQLLSSIIYPILLGNAMDAFSGIDYSSLSMRQKYIQQLINSLTNT